MRSNNEWRDFFLLLCECIAVDPSTVRLDGGFRQLFHWIPRHMGPVVTLQHVLEVMPLDVIVLSIALQCSLGDNGPTHAESAKSTITAPPTIPWSKAEGKRTVPAQCSKYSSSADHVESDHRPNDCVTRKAKRVKLDQLVPPQPDELLFARDALLPVYYSDEILQLAQQLSSSSTTAMVPEVSDWCEVEASFSGGQGDADQVEGNGDNEVDEVDVVVCTDSEDETEREQRTNAATKLAAAPLDVPTLCQAREIMRAAAARAVHGAW